MKKIEDNVNDLFTCIGFKYLIVNLIFPHLGYWGGNFFLIAPFPDHCLLVLFKLSSNHF